MAVYRLGSENVIRLYLLPPNTMRRPSGDIR
jgi:hypothetical protein